jgi:hypothetical protein
MLYAPGSVIQITIHRVVNIYVHMYMTVYTLNIEYTFVLLYDCTVHMYIYVHVCVPGLALSL